MTLFAVEGTVGCDKTFRLMEAFVEALGEAPLQDGQRVLALTFMRGARRRLNGKLRGVVRLKRCTDPSRRHRPEHPCHVSGSIFGTRPSLLKSLEGPLWVKLRHRR
jgi:hypothetical protein